MSSWNFPQLIYIALRRGHGQLVDGRFQCFDLEGGVFTIA